MSSASPSDVQYRDLRYHLSEIEHDYPERVHILCDPYLMTTLARLCAKDTFQPAINELITTIYQNLIKIITNVEFPRRSVEIPSRMVDATPAGVYRGQILDPDTKAVVVNIARAGTVPAHICYTALNYILNPRDVRQDHIIMNRETDDQARVTGVRVGGSKIGGPIEGAYVLFPDPMGATASSMVRAIRIYKEQVEGTARKYIAVHLIVTPEYIRRITEAHPDVEIYAIRLDRGLSAPDVLAERPGARWEREVGLNEHQYVVPGGGGFGEIMNNSYV